MVTSGWAASYLSLSSVSVSVMDAAAKTISSFCSSAVWEAAAPPADTDPSAAARSAPEVPAVPQEARAKVIAQIDKGLPIPILVLQHKNPRFADYVWHWFLLNGYEWRETAAGAEFFVKAVTYGEWEWLDFKCLWDTGHSEKGGLMLFYEKG